jgi:flagellar hook-associated protein 3 FlgL
MRITNNMLINNMINYIGSNLTRMSRLQNQMATGKKISVPSDDPVVAARALKLRTDVAEIEQYKRNAKDAQSWLEMTEDTIAKIGDVLQKARELAVQAANGTNTPDDTQKIMQEIKQLKIQLVHQSNATYAGRYIFSGYKTNSKLINDDENDPDFGSFITDVNNGENIRYEVGIGDDIIINTLGGDLFNNGRIATTTTIPATTGVTTGGEDLAPSFDITAGVNDILSLNIDGELVSIQIPPATYNDMNALASSMQTWINDATVAGTADITVGVVDNRLVFTSGSTGSTSYVLIEAGSTAAADLGLNNADQVIGEDENTPRGTLMQHFDDFISFLNTGDHKAISGIITKLDEDIGNLLRIRADIGARINRVELTTNRLESDDLNFTKLMSENEDIDMAEVIMNLTSEENVYRASLAGGARIIMPTLIDFLR